MQNCAKRFLKLFWDNFDKLFLRKIAPKRKTFFEEYFPPTLDDYRGVGAARSEASPANGQKVGAWRPTECDLIAAQKSRLAKRWRRLRGRLRARIVGCGKLYGAHSRLYRNEIL